MVYHIDHAGAVDTVFFLPGTHGIDAELKNDKIIIYDLGHLVAKIRIDFGQSYSRKTA